LAVGGGVAAFVIVSNSEKGDKKPDNPIITKDTPDAAVVATAKDAAIATNPPDATVAATTPDARDVVAEPKDAGLTLPTDASVVASSLPVLLMDKNGVAFEVYEGGKKVLDGPDNLDIVPGTPRTITIKSRGFKDKQITVDVKDNLATCAGGNCAGDKKHRKV